MIDKSNKNFEIIHNQEIQKLKRELKKKRRIF